MHLILGSYRQEKSFLAPCDTLGTGYDAPPINKHTHLPTHK